MIHGAPTRVECFASPSLEPLHLQVNRALRAYMLRRVRMSVFVGGFDAQKDVTGQVRARAHDSVESNDLRLVHGIGAFQLWGDDGLAYEIREDIDPEAHFEIALDETDGGFSHVGPWTAEARDWMVAEASRGLAGMEAVAVGVVGTDLEARGGNLYRDGEALRMGAGLGWPRGSNWQTTHDMRLESVLDVLCRESYGKDVVAALMPMGERGMDAVAA